MSEFYDSSTMWFNFLPGSRFPVEWHFPLGFLTDRPSSSSPAAANPNPSCLSASSIPKRSQVEQVELGLQPTEPSHQAACHSSTPFRAPLFEFLDSLFPPVLICLYLSLHPASIPLSLACPSVRGRGPPSVSAFKIWTSPVFFHHYKSSAVLLNSISLHKCTFSKTSTSIFEVGKTSSNPECLYSFYGSRRTASIFLPTSQCIRFHDR